MKKNVFIFVLIIPILIYADFPGFDLREITEPDHGNPGVSSGDFNNDGLIDIVATVSDPACIKWYQNVGMDLFWNERIVANVPALYICTADINADDNLDVLVSSSDNRVLLYLNPGDVLQDWDEVEIAVNFTNPHGVDTADIDDDGDLDILATSAGLGKICWWEQDEGNWNEHLVSDAMPNSQSGCLYDLDNDDDFDIIGASSNAHIICVWLNDGTPSVGLTQYIVADSFQLPHWVSVNDLNGDNLPDIMGVSYTNDEVSWWENNGDLPDTWPKHVISNTVNGALTVESEDMDNDGDVDVLATAWISDDVYVWENLDGTALNWTRHTISSYTNGVWSLHITKLDDDEDFDVICGSDPLNPNQVAAPLSWWENDLDPTSVRNEIVTSTNAINIYPNPFNPTTTISFSLNTEITEDTEVLIYNLKGQKIKDFTNQKITQSPNHQIVWNGTDNNSQPVSSGIYLAVLKQDNQILASRKMVLIK
jgi:hypothetical protein